MTEHVLVAVDGSDSANQAVRLATRMAAGRGEELRVVHAFVWPMLGAPLGPPPFSPGDGGLLAAANDVLADAVALARKTADEIGSPVVVDGEVVTGSPVPVLVGESGTATVTVVGDRGLGGFASLLLGSVAVELAHYSTSPVVIVRGNTDLAGPVVVGVDSSESAVKALEWAAAEAARRVAELVVVHAYAPAQVAYPGLAPTDSGIDDAEKQRFADFIDPVLRRYPAVTVRQALIRDTPARVLVEESATAGLVVVGTRGVGALRGLVLGSVSHAVMHHAQCPVAIIR